MPRHSKTMTLIASAYLDNALDLEVAIKGTRRLLRRYRDLAWLHSCVNAPIHSHIASSASAHTSARLLAAFINGEHTPSTNVLNADAAQFILSLMHHILEQVGAYPTYGETYHQILHQSYFDSSTHTDEATAEALHLERSVYYSYKREAIAIYGLVLISTLRMFEDNPCTPLHTQTTHPALTIAN